MNTDWRDSAACRGADTDLFFPDWAAGSGLRDVEGTARHSRPADPTAAVLGIGGG
jgi:hypothetical protein